MNLCRKYISIILSKRANNQGFIRVFAYFNHFVEAGPRSITPAPSLVCSPCPPPLPTSRGYPCDRHRLLQGGKKSAWARTSSNSPSTQKTGGQHRSNSNNNASVARRFDIDEEAADGEEAARIRGGRHSHYSFDTRAGGERAERTGGAGACLLYTSPSPRD